MRPVILGVDMTYKCGKFFVTPTTLQHPMMLHKNTLVEPTLIGPTFIHTHHNEASYRSFGSDLINAQPSLRNIKFSGSTKRDI